MTQPIDYDAADEARVRTATSEERELVAGALEHGPTGTALQQVAYAVLPCASAVAL